MMSEPPDQIERRRFSVRPWMLILVGTLSTSLILFSLILQNTRRLTDLSHRLDLLHADMAAIRDEANHLQSDWRTTLQRMEEQFDVLDRRLDAIEQRRAR
jgi:hypothetical protein